MLEYMHVILYIHANLDTSGYSILAPCLSLWLCVCVAAAAVAAGAVVAVDMLSSSCHAAVVFADWRTIAHRICYCTVIKKRVRI